MEPRPLPTPRQQYAKALEDIAKRYSRLDDQTVRRLISLLQETRKEIAIQLLNNPTAFESFRLGQLRASIDQIIGEFQTKLNTSLRSSFSDATGLGAASVIEPLAAVGVGASFNTISPQLVNTAVDFSAELVQNIAADLRQSINTQLRLAVLAQQSPFVAMKNITKALGIKASDGIWGKRRRPELVRGVAARSETIVRTEMTRIFNLATHSQQREAAEAIPGLTKRWIATADERTRDSHIAAHQATLTEPIPIDEPFNVGGSSLMFPGDPAGPAGETINCLLPGNEVVAPGVLAATRSTYKGPAIELTFGDDKKLSVTPNHPILTTNGFVAAKLLNEGGYIISSGRGEEIASAIDPNYDYMPTAVEDVWRSIFVSAKSRNVSRIANVPHNFYGDGRFVDGYVDIVRADSLLGSDIGYPSFAQEFCEDDLGWGYILESFLSGDSPFFEFFERTFFPLDRDISRLCDGLSLLEGHTRKPRSVCLTSVPSDNANAGQKTSDCGAGNAVPAGQGDLGFSFEVSAGAGVRDHGRPFSNFDSVFKEPGPHHPFGYIELGRKFLDRFAGLVETNCIRNIRYFNFSGHVYDLQTIEGLYISNTCVVKNCRCTTAIVHPDVEPIKTPLDASINREIDKREKQAA